MGWFSATATPTPTLLPPGDGGVMATISQGIADGISTGLADGIRYAMEPLRVIVTATGWIGVILIIVLAVPLVVAAGVLAYYITKLILTLL